MALMITCPHCETSYTAARCGLVLDAGQRAHADIACKLCGKKFAATILPRVVATAEQPGWWARVVMRQKPVVTETLDGHTVETFAKE